MTARDNAAGGSTLRWNTSAGQGFIHEGRRGDIYAGRDGNVYRNTGDGWQKFDGGWQDVAAAGAGRTAPARRRAARVFRPRPASGSRSGVEARRLEGLPEPVLPVRRALRSASA